MDASFAQELIALEAATATASAGRALAHERLVQAFRAQLEGTGPGPSEADVQCFARLALVERALQEELRCAAELMGSAERHAAAQ